MSSEVRMPKPHIPLDELQAQVANCRKCALCETRTQTVFGDGNPDARVLFVGEAPGKNEDLQGIPFVGKAGQNLNTLLEIAGLKREDVFIANVLKCRPPGNRDPRPEEIEICTPYLREQTQSPNKSPQYCAITVPSGMPTKPSPGQEPTPKASRMLAPMLTALMIRSSHIESMEFCIPTSQPRRAIRLIVAGAAQMRMKK